MISCLTFKTHYTIESKVKSTNSQPNIITITIICTNIFDRYMKTVVSNIDKQIYGHQ